MGDLKKKLNTMGSKQASLYILATVLLTLAIWFIISNSVFLIRNLDRAFGSERITPQQVEQFDREGFQKLNLLTER